MADANALRGAWERGAVAELAYRVPGGVDLVPVVPLLDAATPCIALHYGQRDLAERIAASGVVAIALSDVRMARKGWEPLGATAQVELTEDAEGVEFVNRGLLGQELVKYPPSRELADSPLLRREYWWYVPRLLLRLVHVDRVRAVGRRSEDQHGVLAYTLSDSVDIDTVSLATWDGDRIGISSLAGRNLLAVDGAPGVVGTHDFEVPDWETSSRYVARGWLRAATLEVEARHGRRGLPARPGLRERLRALRALERACRQGLESSRLGS